MLRTFLASILTAFTLLPQTVEPPGSNPTRYVTRAEAAAALLLARDPNVKVIKNTNQFPDIRRGDWYEHYMLAAQKAGIVSAEPDTNLLKPTAFINRVEFLKMVALTFTIPTGYTHAFTDIPKDSWYSDYAGIVRKFDLPLMDDPQHLGPSKPVTQEDAFKTIQVFMRLYNQVQSSIFDEQRLAIEQSQKGLQIYNVISTRRTNVVFTDSQNTSAAKPIATNPPRSLPQLRTDIVSLVNIARLQAGLRPLSYNSQLEYSAQVYAERMAKEGFFGHVSPDGQTLKDRVSATGYYDRSYSADCGCVKGFVLGENLGRGQTTAAQVMEDWMKSSNHRAAILSADYTEIGIGVSGGIWVQHFGGTFLPGQKISSLE